MNKPKTLMEVYAKSQGLNQKEFVQEIISTVAAMASMHLDLEEAKGIDTVTYIARDSTHVISIEVTRALLQ